MRAQARVGDRVDGSARCAPEFPSRAGFVCKGAFVQRLEKREIRGRPVPCMPGDGLVHRPARRRRGKKEGLSVVWFRNAEVDGRRVGKFKFGWWGNDERNPG